MNAFDLEIHQVRLVSNLTRLEQSLKSLPGITSIAIDAGTNVVAHITYEDTDLKEMFSVLEFHGYDARLRPVHVVTASPASP